MYQQLKALISSKLQAAPFQDGFRASKRVPLLGSGSVANSKNAYCSWLEYHPLVASYARGDIGPQFASAYRLPIPQHAPFAIGYTFENLSHHYLPDVVGTLANGKPVIAEAGMEDDKRGDRNLANGKTRETRRVE